MEVSKLQIEIKKLVKTINYKHQHKSPEAISYMKLIEEVGELTQSILKTQISNRKHTKNSVEDVKNELSDEFSDVVISLFALANDFDIDLENEINKKLEKHKERLNEY